MKQTAVALVLLGSVLPVWADYVVDIDLGVLPVGDTPLVGTTAELVLDPGPPPVTIGGNNNSLFVRDEFDDPLIVQGHIQTWGNEIVYRFELATAAFLSITSNSIQGDADFFLLEALTTSPDPLTGKLSADRGIDVALLDGPPGETTNFFPVRPGTYYLAVENYDGVDGELEPGDTTFDVTLRVAEAEPIDLAIDIGPIAAAGSPVYLDTFGSGFNTKLAIYDLFGNVLFENDDAGGGEQSEITIAEGLPEGIYYAVIGGTDAVFDDSFGITPGSVLGDYVLNFPLGPLLDPGELTGATTAGLPVEFILFNIVARPLASETIPLGVIADADEPFVVDTRGSDFDTQLAMFDSEGFWQAVNDDILFIEPGDPGNILQSELVFDEGLPEGTYYLSVAGWPYQYGDGFFLEVDTVSSPVSEGGTFQLNYPGGSESGSIPSNDHQWFSFEVAAVAEGGIAITSIDYNPGTKEFTVSWDSSLSGPFRILAGNASDLEALQAPPDNVLPIEAATDVTSPATFTLPGGLDGLPQVFLQVTN